MAHPNEELIKSYAQNWADGDVQAATDKYADDIVLHVPGRHRLSGDYRGKQAVLDYINQLVEWTGGKVQLLETVDVLANDRRAVDLIRARYEREGKKPLEVNRIVVYLIADNKIQELWVHDDDQYAVDEFFS